MKILPGSLQNNKFENFSYLNNKQQIQNKNQVTFAAINSSKQARLMQFDKLFFWENLKTSVLIKLDAAITYKSAKKAIANCDKLYGKDNYTFIIIGRSAAALGETMQLLGQDVKLLPMSNVTNSFQPQDSSVEKYKEYLNSIGLTKEFIENNPQRKFLLVDFVYTGLSLKSAHSFLSQPDLLGSPDRLKPVSTEVLLGYKGFLKAYINLLFRCNGFKYCSPVKKLPFTELNKVFESIVPDDAASKERKLFLYFIMKKVNVKRQSV